VANSQGFYAEEARILWILAKLIVEKQPAEALTQIKEWQWYEPQGKSSTALHSYLCAWVCIKAHAARQANLILNNIDKIGNSDKLPLYDYLLAESYFLIGKYVEASQNYLSYLAVYQGNRYIKDAYFKLYVIAEITGQIATAKLQKSNILKNGALQTEADRYAQKFAEGKAAGSPKLFRLRFLTDGGEYEQATQWLQQHTVQTFEKGAEQTEYYYRIARLCHLTQQYSQAITHYQQVLSQSYTPKTYFAPNAALQMGLLCMQQLQKKDLAKYYFKKVLDYQDYEYEKGIRYEAQRYLKQF
jgi:TolA-binding protein